MTPMSSPLSISCSRSMCIGNGIIRLQSYDFFQTWRRLRAEYVASAAVKPCPHAAAVEPPWSRGRLAAAPYSPRVYVVVASRLRRIHCAFAPFLSHVCGSLHGAPAVLAVRMRPFCRASQPFLPPVRAFAATGPSPFCRPYRPIPTARPPCFRPTADTFCGLKMREKQIFSYLCNRGATACGGPAHPTNRRLWEIYGTPCWHDSDSASRPER